MRALMRAQVQVSLNGQQYEKDTAASFQFGRYCSGLKQETAGQAEFFDHPVGKHDTGPPRPYSFCQWLIQVDAEEAFGDADAEGITIALQASLACALWQPYAITASQPKPLPELTVPHRECVTPLTAHHLLLLRSSQIEQGSRLLNVGFDYLSVYDGIDRNTSPLLLKWPVTIADLDVVPDTIVSTGNALLVEFRTGAFSSSPDVYEGFKAKCESPIKTLDAA